jgi:putative transposase
MATPQRTATQGTFFLTTVCYNRRRIFQVTRNAELFLETLDHCRPHYELHAYVVMPDHVHLILTPRGKTLPQVMNLIKGGFSHKLASKLPVWQRGYTDHLIQSPADFAVRQNYTHQNPVAGQLVEAAELYPYSSASPGVRMDPYPG